MNTHAVPHRCLHNLSCQYSFTFRTIHAAIEKETKNGRDRKAAIRRAKGAFGAELVNSALDHVKAFTRDSTKCFLELQVGWFAIDRT